MTMGRHRGLGVHGEVERRLVHHDVARVAALGAREHGRRGRGLGQGEGGDIGTLRTFLSIMLIRIYFTCTWIANGERKWLWW